jgi:hypothetical protein
MIFFKFNQMLQQWVLDALNIFKLPNVNGDNQFLK